MLTLTVSPALRQVIGHLVEASRPGLCGER